MQTETPSPDCLLKLLKMQVFHGPNPWAPAPAVVCELAVTAVSGSLQALWQRLQAAAPDWTFSAPPPGAVEPDETPRWLGRWVMEWARAALNEVRGCVREGGVQARGAGQVLIWVGFHHPQVTQAAIRLGLSAVEQAGRPRTDGTTPETETALDALWQACRRWHPDYQARILMVAARAMNVPVLPWNRGDDRLWQFGWGQKSRVFFESRSNNDGCLGHEMARSKSASKEFLRSLGFPVAPHGLVMQPAELPGAAASIGWPCVAKPLDRGGGKGVTAGIRDLATLQQAFAHARSFTQGPVMVEAFVAGDDHRLMVVNGQLVAAIRRDPPSVHGDGQRSVRDLIQTLNRGRSPNIVASHYRRPVQIDAVVQACLRQQGLDLESVPAAGQRVGLRSNSNLSTGGSCTDVTAQVHPAVQRLAQAIATSLGLQTCGVDYITTDISRPWRETGGVVIEMNTTPGLEAAVAAGADEVLVGSQVLGDVPGRLPTVLLLAPAALQQTWLPALQEVVAQRPGLAWLCAGDSGVGDLPLGTAGRPLHERIAPLLRNRLSESLLIVCTADHVLREGVPLDRLDRVLVCQQVLPAPWQAVLGSAAPCVQQLDDPAAAWAAALVP